MKIDAHVRKTTAQVVSFDEAGNRTVLENFEEWGQYGQQTIKRMVKEKLDLKLPYRDIILLHHMVKVHKIQVDVEDVEKQLN